MPRGIYRVGRGRRTPIHSEAPRYHAPDPTIRLVGRDDTEDVFHFLARVDEEYAEGEKRAFNLPSPD
jgi:hypothetical protein